MSTLPPDKLPPIYAPELLRELDQRRPAFVYRDCHVFRSGGARVCSTTSRTMARRICNALNQYTPNDRGY